MYDRLVLVERLRLARFSSSIETFGVKLSGMPGGEAGIPASAEDGMEETACCCCCCCSCSFLSAASLSALMAAIALAAATSRLVCLLLGTFCLAELFLSAKEMEFLRSVRDTAGPKSNNWLDDLADSLCRVLPSMSAAGMSSEPALAGAGRTCCELGARLEVQRSSMFAWHDKAW
jgi:hypothetical protein